MFYIKHANIFTLISSDLNTFNKDGMKHERPLIRLIHRPPLAS